MTDPLLQAAADVFLSPQIWAIVLASAAFGVFIGSTPGLTATMAMALIVPVTYWLGPVPAIAAMVTLVACAIFAGDIPGVLLRIPGTPASAAYADDAYAFTQRGQPERPLGVCLVMSVAGGLFGALVLMLIGQWLAQFAAEFSAAEYFWLYLLGLSCAVVVSQTSRLRAAVGLLIGLLLATVGLSSVHAQARFTFDRPELYEGINFIPAMIGLFGVSEVLKNLLLLSPQAAERAPGNLPDEFGFRIQRFFLGALAASIPAAFGMLIHRFKAFLRSGSIGALIGMLPGAGADIAAFVSLAVSKRSSPSGADLPDSSPNQAEGNPSITTAAAAGAAAGSTVTDAASEDRALAGIADATTANSASLAGAWIPALVFGIPGDSVTAIAIGVLLMKDVKPGPEIFVKQPALIYSIYLLFILANLVLLPVGLLAVRAGGQVVRVPRPILLPIILLFCVVGAYAINGNSFDVGVMLVMGLAGFFLERRGVPLAPVVLGMILGGPLEERFIQTITAADGSPFAFVGFERDLKLARPLAALLAVVFVAIWAAIALRAWAAWRREKRD